MKSSIREESHVGRVISNKNRGREGWLAPALTDVRIIGYLDFELSESGASHPSQPLVFFVMSSNCEGGGKPPRPLFLFALLSFVFSAP